MIDYTCTDIAGTAQTYDVIYDTLGYSSYGRLRRNLSATGRYNCPVLSGKLLCAALATGLLSRGKAAGMQPMGELRELLAQVLILTRSRVLTPLMDRSYPLADLIAAHR